MGGDHQTASIISISWIAVWLGTTRRPASSASAASIISIISISWIAFWLGTTRRPASSASAGSCFGCGPPDGQHHQHQLDRGLAVYHKTASMISISWVAVWPVDDQTASIISISWIAFWLGTTRRPASSASAGSCFGCGPPDGQHHQHQLDRGLAVYHKTASMISISWVAVWPVDDQTASIFSISWIAFWRATTRRPASSASAGSRFGWGLPPGQHHQHQLDRVLAGDHQTASIFSISWIAFWLGITRQRASSASAGSRFGWGPPPGQQHQHQLGRVLAGDHQTASIISISWIAFWLGTTKRPASHFGWGQPDRQHQHQLDRILAGDHQTASIISISWIALWLGTTRRPASSASAGSLFGWGPPDGQHHQHQLGLAGPPDGQHHPHQTTRRPASSASAGSLFGWGPPDGQHHQHQLDRVLAGDHQTASIISISWVAFWLGTATWPDGQH